MYEIITYCTDLDCRCLHRDGVVVGDAETIDEAVQVAVDNHLYDDTDIVYGGVVVACLI